MLKKCLLLAVFYLCSPLLHAQSSDIVVSRVANHWIEMHNKFKTPSDAWGNYTLDLTHEAFLLYDQLRQKDSLSRIVTEIFNKRGIASKDTINYRTQPFCSINFLLGISSNNPGWHVGYIAETYRMIDEAVKSPEGGIMHSHEGNCRILIDYMQEYTSRVARTGCLTDDSLLYDESVKQYLIYEHILRDRNTGLWCQGRGWCPDPDKLSEGSWSRGHGWLMRGLVTTMLCLPEKQVAELLPVLRRVSSSLLEVQTKSGMYHILLNQPEGNSAPDVSGTGMIAYYMSVAVINGWLERTDYQSSILKATGAMKNYISAQGEILSSSKGPGPLCEQEEYIGYIPEIDEKHGFQGAIYGMMAEIILTLTPAPEHLLWHFREAH